MIGVTADTNIYISALVFAGAPRQLLREAEAGNVRLAVSEAILNEVRGMLLEKFAWSDDAIKEATSLLAGCTTLVQPA